MDLKTSFALYAAVLMTCGVSLLITWRQHPHEVAPRSWAIGALYGAASLVIFTVFALNPEMVWGTAVGILAAWLCAFFYARGVRQFVGLPANPRWMVVVYVVSTIVLFAGLALTSYGPALLIVMASGLTAVYSIDLAASVLVRSRTRKAPAWLIGIFFFLFGAANLARSIVTALDPTQQVYERPIDTGVIFMGILGGFATAVGFAMLIAERHNEARARHRDVLDAAVAELRDKFERLAAGDYAVRVRHEGTNEHLDVLAHRFNETAPRLGAAFHALDRQRALLAATFESMVDGLALLDVRGDVVRANPAVAALVGVEGRRLQGQPLRHLLADEEAAFADDVMSTVARAPIRERSTRFRTTTGTSVPLPTNVSAYRDRDGAIQGAVLVIRDDRELEEARAQLQMADRLAAMGTVAGGVAHEINNPLAFVVTNLDFVLEELVAAQGAPNAETRAEILEALESAQRGGQRVRQIVQELKRFSRSDGEGVVPIYVNRLVQSATTMLENEVRHHARLHLDLGPTLVVHAAEAALGQVVLNLIHNAVQAIPPGHVREHEIRVSTRTTAGSLALIEVSDTGSGIAPEVLPKIFDAFFTTRPVGTAAGLGLAICHRVVTSLGGRIEVVSEVGRGSTFRVYLPGVPVAT